MKEVFYSDKKVFLLTNKEFKEAVLAWDRRENYWCQRIEELLTPLILHAGTPALEVGRDIYILPLMDGGKVVKARKIFKAEDGKHYEILDENGVLMPVLDLEIRDKNLIAQEDYYNKKVMIESSSAKNLT